MTTAVGYAAGFTPNATYEDAPDAETSLHFALEAFVTNTGVVNTGVEDFTSNFGGDAKALREYLAGLSKSKLPAAGWQEGYEATVSAIKANEAIVKGQKIALQKEWFEI